MESFGNFFNEEWHRLGSPNDSIQGFITSESDVGLNIEIPNIFFSVTDESNNVESFEHFANASNDVNANFYHLFSKENSFSSNGASNDTISLSHAYRGDFPFCSSNLYNFTLPKDVADESIKLQMVNEMNNSLLPANVISCGTRQKRGHETLDLEDTVDEEDEKNQTKEKKRIRVSRENKTKISVESRKKMKEIENENHNNGGQSSSSCSSIDECNGSQDMNGTINPSGKTRASRGTATDPQSVYARKRRERINERLRILQNLVPNGTKVDISTMLEEAVEYVKFLKLQIQLLSSDEMWMYAPIAYNGMDMGLYQNVTQNL